MIAWKVIGHDAIGMIKSYLIGVPLLILWAYMAYKWFTRMYYGYYRKAYTLVNEKQQVTREWVEPLVMKWAEKKGGNETETLLLGAGIKSFLFLVTGAIVFYMI